jgi:hypothetical protein
MKTIFFRLSLLLIATTVFFPSCQKDKPIPPSGNGTSVTPGSGAYVIDEGNYLGGNAKI